MNDIPIIDTSWLDLPSYTCSGGNTTAGGILTTLSADLSEIIPSGTNLKSVLLKPGAYSDRYNCIPYIISDTSFSVKIIAVGTYTNPFTTIISARILY